VWPAARERFLGRAATRVTDHLLKGACTITTIRRGTVNREARWLRRDPELIVMGCKLEIFELLLDQKRTSQVNGIQ